MQPHPFRSQTTPPSACDTPTICRRCGTLLTPGKGDFYIVKVEAYAENSPPVITAADLAQDHRAEMERLAEQMQNLSEREMMDMVYRRLAFFLCTPCYRHWIENPTG